jgi:hypothetical protein
MVFFNIILELSTTVVSSSVAYCVSFISKNVFHLHLFLHTCSFYALTNEQLTLLPRIIRAESLCCRLKRVEGETKCYISANRFYYCVRKQAPRPWKYVLVRRISASGRDASFGLDFVGITPQKFIFQTFVVWSFLLIRSKDIYEILWGLRFSWQILLMFCSYGMWHWHSLKVKAAGFSQIFLSTTKLHGARI